MQIPGNVGGWNSSLLYSSVSVYEMTTTLSFAARERIGTISVT